MEGRRLSALVTSDWLELFVSAAESVPNELLQKNVFRPANISLTAATGQASQCSLDMSQFDSGEEIVVGGPDDCIDGGADPELSIILTCEQRTPMLMRYFWSGLT